MKTITSALAAILALSTMTAPLTAQANEWKGVPYGYFFPKGKIVTGSDIQTAKEVTLPHCEDFAAQTTPKRWRTIVGHAISNGIVGGGASTAQVGIQYSVLGARLATNALPAAGLGVMAGSALLGALQGNTLTNERLRSTTAGCLVRDAGGIYSMTPKEGEEILRTGVPEKAGSPSPLKNGALTEGQ